MLVIGIAGKKRSGKDTVAQMLMQCAEKVGIKATKRAFADALKEECATMVVGHLPEEIAIDVLKEMCTDEKKEKFRLLLQWWGTEFKRKMVSDTYWLDKLQNWILQHCNTEREVVVVPDVRFLNEVEMIKQLGGVVIKIHRPGITTEDNHISETGLDDYKDWDGIITNNSDLEALELKTAKLFLMLFDWTWGQPE